MSRKIKEVDEKHSLKAGEMVVKENAVVAQSFEETGFVMNEEHVC